jgi:hypothetical protein
VQSQKPGSDFEIDGSAVTVAVLSTLPPFAVQAAKFAPPAVVVFTVTVNVAPTTIEPTLHVSCWLTLMLQDAALGAGVIRPVEETLSTAHVVKLPGVGNGSVNTTLDAVPGPVLVNTTVNGGTTEFSTVYHRA